MRLRIRWGLCWLAYHTVLAWRWGLIWPLLPFAGEYAYSSDFNDSAKIAPSPRRGSHDRHR